MAENPWGQGPRPEGRSKEWELLEKVAMASVDEQRRTRRWGILFKLLTFGYLFTLMFMMLKPVNLDKAGDLAGSHTAVITVAGPIADDAEANASAINEGLNAAFKASGSKAVVLKINSPGGSPVQSAYVYDEIRRLKAAYPNKKVYAVITDMGASGAYYMAAAADQIYVSPASLVGSIGVVMQGFGVQGLMDKLGLEDRTMTAGSHKALLSPFEAVSEEEKVHIQSMLDTIHHQFITAVKQGRGQRLKDNPDIFSGLFWTGQQSVELGLADGFGSVESVAKAAGAETLVDYSVSLSPFASFMKRFGASIGEGFAAKMSLSAEPTLR